MLTARLKKSVTAWHYLAVTMLFSKFFNGELIIESCSQQSLLACSAVWLLGDFVCVVKDTIRSLEAVEVGVEL